MFISRGRHGPSCHFVVAPLNRRGRQGSYFSKHFLQSSTADSFYARYLLKYELGSVFRQPVCGESDDDDQIPNPLLFRTVYQQLTYFDLPQYTLLYFNILSYIELINHKDTRTSRLLKPYCLRLHYVAVLSYYTMNQTIVAKHYIIFDTKLYIY